MHALLNNPPFISAKIPSHIWDFFPAPLGASSILPAPPASYCQHGLFCTALPVCSAFGNVWISAGSWAQRSVRYPFSQPRVWVRGMDQKSELTVLAQKAENTPGLPEALAL